MKRKLKIHFNDGNTMEFAFPPAISEYNIGEYINQMMTLSNLILEAENRVFLFPTQNIKFLEVHPAPEKLGTQIIRAATIIS